MDNSKVNIGIIGVGKMGEYHLQKYLRLSEAQVVGFYEPNAIRAQEVSSIYRVKAFANLSELLFESDAVSVASPTQSHFQNCKQALDAGVHVLVEKPMCDNLTHAEELVAIAGKNELLLQVGYLERFRLKRLQNRLQKAPIRFVDAHWLSTDLPREQTIDVVGDMLVHPLDMVLSLIGEEPVRWSVVGARVLTDHLDMISVRLEFPTGAMANLWVSRASSHKERKIFLFSTREQAAINFSTNEIEIMRSNDGQIQREVHDLGANGSAPDVLLEQCAAFLQSIKKGQGPVVTGKDGLKVLRLSNHLRESALRELSREKTPLERGMDFSLLVGSDEGRSVRDV